jgi:hypothetical protein
MIDPQPLNGHKKLQIPPLWRQTLKAQAQSHLKHLRCCSSKGRGQPYQLVAVLWGYGCCFALYAISFFKGTAFGVNSLYLLSIGVTRQRALLQPLSNACVDTLVPPLLPILKRIIKPSIYALEFQWKTGASCWPLCKIKQKAVSSLHRIQKLIFPNLDMRKDRRLMLLCGCPISSPTAVCVMGW